MDSQRVPVNGQERDRRRGGVPYYGANGQQGFIDRPLFDEPLILVAEDGGNFDEYATRPIAYRIDGPSWVNNHAHVLRAAGATNLSFLFHSLEHRDIRRFIAGGTRTKLTQAELRAIEIGLPPQREQRQIAEVLDEVDHTIRQTHLIITKLRRVKRGLIEDLLTLGFTSDGSVRRPLCDPDEFKESPLGRVPREWDVTSVEAVSEFVTSGSRGWGSYYSDSGAVFMRIGNLTRDHINLRRDNVVRVSPPNSEGKRTRLEPGDVLLSITADLGIVGVVPNDLGEAYVNQHIALVRVAPSKANCRWVAHYLSGTRAQALMRRFDDQGAKAGLNLPSVRGFPLALPPRPEQDEIAARLDAADTAIGAGAIREEADLDKGGACHGPRDWSCDFRGYS